MCCSTLLSHACTGCIARCHDAMAGRCQLPANIAGASHAALALLSESTPMNALRAPRALPLPRPGAAV